MTNHYVINKNWTLNPGFHHEVHTRKHAEELKVANTIYLGWFASEEDAVKAGKSYYADADGCAICCPRAHKG